ncbi:MAG: DNA repair and recombination protein RadA [Asgard group archaeon]|nr:DNA repair and recombination protein RadA [Asgard group archaeon]
MEETEKEEKEKKKKSKKKDEEKEKEEEKKEEKKDKKNKKEKEEDEEEGNPDYLDVISRDEEKEIPVTDLSGVGPATAHKLEEGGFTSIRSIALSSVKELEDNASLGEKTAAKLIKMCQEQVGLTFQTADNLYHNRMKIARITTGSDNLDELFGGGGMETGSITELFGEFRTGKTQIAHQMCVTVQLPRERGGLEANAAYIDTEGTFRPERIVEIAQRFELDPDETLSNITVGRAYTSDHQMSLSRDIGKIAREKNIRLFVLDSLTSHFRAEYVGRGTLATRQQKLNQHIHFLLKLAEMYHLAILVTNQVMARPDFFFGDPTAPVGGNIVAHSCTTRVYLRKSKQTKRVARIVDSPNLPEHETVFEILSDGIHDG